MADTMDAGARREYLDAVTGAKLSALQVTAFRRTLTGGDAKTRHIQENVTIPTSA